MIKKSRSEKGQALVLIMLGIVGILSLSALAIDGGNAFADRRQAQSAADTAALAAAMTIINGNGDYQAVALQRAASNGYSNNGEDSVVVNNPPVLSAAYQGNSEYIEVVVTSTIDTWLAGIVGVKTITNVVTAVARAKPGTTGPLFFGNAFVSLMPGCKPQGYPDDPFTITGTAINLVTGSGIFVNSNCANALTQNGSSTLTADSITVVGTCNYGANKVNPAPSCSSGTPIPWPPAITWPNPSCSGNGVVTKIANDVYSAGPGRYSGDFPSDLRDPAVTQGNNSVPTGSKIILLPGTFCIEEMTPTSTWTVTTDVNGNNVDDSSEGVLFFVSGQVKLTAQVNVTMSAQKTGEFAGLLFYSPLGDPVAEKGLDYTITGGGDSKFIGTILAPSRTCTVSGNGATLTLSSQIICYANKMAGTGSVVINYDNANNYDVTYPPIITITQ